MKIGIDSYCHHRYFGEVYPIQSRPDRTMSLEDFLKRAVELRVDCLQLIKDLSGDDRQRAPDSDSAL